MVQKSQYYNCRSSYQHSKVIAGTAKAMYAGKEIAKLPTVDKDLALWLSTVGEGFGKLQYRRVKTSFSKQEVCKFPPYEDLSKHWKENITVEAMPLYEKDTDIVIGMYYDPVRFIPKNMVRWLERRELEGKPLPPGSYDLRFKVSFKPG